MMVRFDGGRWVRHVLLWGTAVVSGCQGPEAVRESEPAVEPAPGAPSTGAEQTPSPTLPEPRAPDVTPAPLPPPVTAPGLDARRPWWRASYPGGVSPQSLAVGDFDGDGAPDVVVGARGGNYQGRFASSQGTLRVLRNDGRGGLGATSSLHPLVGPTGSLAVGDVNGDGRLDVLTGTRLGSQTWLGQGNGALVGLGRERAVGTEPSVNLGVWRGRDGQPLLWHLGIGEVWSGTGSPPRFVLARLRGEQVLEQWEPLPDDISLRQDSRYDPALKAAVADFNGDGLLDAVFSQDQSVAGSTEVSRVFLGGDAGRLVAGDALYPLRAFLRVSTADFNRDGRADLLVLYPDARSVGVLLGTGRGTFSSVAALSLPDKASEVAVVEWSGDGVPDVVALHEASDSASLFKGRGDGGFTWQGGLAVGRHPSAVAVADLDADGRPELLVAEQGDNTVSVYTPPTVFQSRPVLPALCPWPSRNEDPVAKAPVTGGPFNARDVSGSEWVVAGDFDSDGKMDLALAKYYGGVQVMGHEQAGHHALWELEGPRGRFMTQLAAGDFDGDGRTDLAGLYQPNGRDKPPYVPVIFWNDARSSFSEVLELTRWNDKVGLLAADFNRDGLMDLALSFVGDTEGTASRWMSQGQRLFRRELLPERNPTGDPAHPSLTRPLLAAGDLTGEGTQALLHTTSTGVTLSPTAREGTPRPGQGYGVNLAQGFSTLADVDGDGHADALFADASTSYWPRGVTVMRGDGRGSLGAPLECEMPRWGRLVAWRDLDGDGIEDALVVSASTVWAMLRTADGRWRALIPHDVAGDYDYSVTWTTSVDLEGDSRPELLVLAQGGTLWIFPPPEP